MKRLNIQSARIRLLPALFLLAAFVLATAAAPAQEQKKPEKKDETQQVKNSQNREVRFVDEDGDGINDISEQKDDGDGTRQQIRERRRDHFIDEDGDGINDERCSGMGISRGQRWGQQKGGQK